MKQTWIAPAMFGGGTFFIILGTADGFGFIDVSQNTTALFLVGIGLFMLGAAYTRSQKARLRK